MIQPVMAELARWNSELVVFAQDDPSGFEDLAVTDDTSLEQSFHHDIETVPTIIRFANGKEVDRTIGWSRKDWERVAERSGLGGSLPALQSGCSILKAASPAFTSILSPHSAILAWHHGRSKSEMG